MPTTRVTATVGIVLLVLGIAGFIPGLLQAPLIGDPALIVDQFYGRVFGLFPVNVLHNIVRIALGIWGIAAAKSLTDSVRYCRSVSVFYVVLMLMGLVPGLNTVFGLVPLHSHNIWFSALTALALGYFGYRSAPITRRQTI